MNSTYFNINCWDVQRKNVVNNVDMSSLRTLWQNGPYKNQHTEQHKTFSNILSLCARWPITQSNTNTDTLPFCKSLLFLTESKWERSISFLRPIFAHVFGDKVSFCLLKTHKFQSRKYVAWFHSNTILVTVNTYV